SWPEAASQTSKLAIGAIEAASSASFASFLATSMTWNPRPASSLEASAPMPLEAPVTSANFCIVPPRRQVTCELRHHKLKSSLRENDQKMLFIHLEKGRTPMSVVADLVEKTFRFVHLVPIHGDQRDLLSGVRRCDAGLAGRDPDCFPGFRFCRA